jgi:hypothetical protein
MVSTTSSPVQSQVSDWKFVETWIDPTSEIPYVLLLVADEAGEYKIYDPKENYTVVFASRSYDEAKVFLTEDEYEQIRGRYQEGC